MYVEQKIRELLYKYYPDAAKEQEITRAFILELGTLVQDVISKRSQDLHKEGALVPIRELEELLVVLRDLKAKYEDEAEHTTSDIIRLDELKQLEYKLTEKILANR